MEDEPILAFAIEELLIEDGFQIAGVTGKLETALTIIASGNCDAAILDANLKGVSAAPAATALKTHGIAFIVLSGYARDQQQTAFSDAVQLQKPCSPERLLLALHTLLTPGA